jgi:hypothetical protein
MSSTPPHASGPGTSNRPSGAPAVQPGTLRIRCEAGEDISNPVCHDAASLSAGGCGSFMAATAGLHMDQGHADETAVYPGIAHAQGVLMIARADSSGGRSTFSQLLPSWGNIDAFACYPAAHRREPREEECGFPLHQPGLKSRVQPYSSELATDFGRQQLSWEDVRRRRQGRGHRSEQQVLVLDLSVWLLVLLRVYDRGKLFERRSWREIP